jgi:hypothetical protein
MTTLSTGAVVGLLGLGALHGINPAMGWLFAVALGLQEKRGRAVWRALGPLAAGHFLAIGAVVALVALVGTALEPDVVRWLLGLTLVGFGGWRFIRHRHPRYGGMRMGAGQLTVWSFLMAWAHGAGLMVVPFMVTASSAAAGGHAADAAGAMAGHAAHAAGMAGASGMAAMAGEPLAAGILSGQALGLWVTLVHTAGYLLVTGLVAVVVYEKLGLSLLRKAWVNLDLFWAGALVVTGLVTLVV